MVVPLFEPITSLASSTPPPTEASSDPSSITKIKSPAKLDTLSIGQELEDRRLELGRAMGWPLGRLAG